MILYDTCLSLSDLLSLSVITSQSIHVAADDIISSFLWLRSIPLCVCVYVCVHNGYIYTTSSLSIHLSMNI